MNLLVVAAGVLVAAVAAVRWLRVAQREHYIPGSASRFALRWWGCGWANRLLAALALAAAAASAVWAPAGLAAALLAAAGPLGLGLRGRTAPLRWTARLRRLAAASAVLSGLAVAAAALAGAGPTAAALLALAVPLLVDLGAAAAAPLERRLSRRYVERAAERVRRLAPTVVAVTGSYGKTTTKEYVRHLLAPSRNVVASPASFNNALGLARTVNDHLDPGVQVLVAEMGTYGPGEIAALTRWLPPKVSVITALGPVHLERFGSLEAIATAKAEIVDGAEVVVVNGDEPRIEAAVRRVAPSVRLIRCSELDPQAEVYVEAGEEGARLLLRGEPVGTLAADVFPMNAACAVGVAAALGVPTAALAGPLASLPTPAHRRQLATAPSGVVVIDDTYNSNPRGAEAAVELLARCGRNGARRAVVTPGMVELGRRQHPENVAFARKAAATATDVVIVGRTNRRALLQGVGDAAAVTLVRTREEGVGWVRAHLHTDDAVLYENDLPDHYP